nr:dephospho-CoA kinase [Corynebacterium lactis]
MLKIGLTGGMGSGKSTVAARLCELGATVIDADRIAREIVEPGQPALAELAEEFGGDIITDSGELDRALLARRVFASESATATLNAITHPRIAARTQELYDAAGDGIVVYDMPLLIENGLDADQDLVLVVHAPVELRLDRLVNSRGVDREDAARRIAAQVDDATRIAKADVVLDNSGTKEELIAQVDKAWKERILPAAS